MNEAQARTLLSKAIEDLYKKDFDVNTGRLPPDVNERTATHRLALYLEQRIRAGKAEGLDVAPDKVFVDCEYNRIGAVDKKQIIKDYLDILAEEEKAEGSVDWRSLARRLLDDGNGLTVYPDIIVHKRGRAEDGGRNLIVVEVKKQRAGKKAVELDRVDREKLQAYKNNPHLKYDHAFFVKLHATQDETIANIEYIT